VLVTTEDRAIRPLEQVRLALAVKGATIHRVEDGHVVCAHPEFAPPLLEAIQSVADRL
jgi:hypothetical protein